MEDGRIPKDLLYGELESGSRPVGRPKLCFKDVCERDMLATGLPKGNWETPLQIVENGGLCEVGPSR